MKESVKLRYLVKMIIHESRRFILTKSEFTRNVKRKSSDPYSYLKESFWTNFGQYGNKMDFIIVDIPISSVKTTETNQNIDKIKKIMNSITKNGFNEPILLTEDYHLKNGHHRFVAMKQLGYSNVFAFIDKDFNSDVGKILNYNDYF